MQRLLPHQNDERSANQSEAKLHLSLFWECPRLRRRSHHEMVIQWKKIKHNNFNILYLKDHTKVTTKLYRNETKMTLIPVDGNTHFCRFADSGPDSDRAVSNIYPDSCKSNPILHAPFIPKGRH